MTGLARLSLIRQRAKWVSSRASTGAQRSGRYARLIAR